ncbi:ribokinase-like [Styela clava]
MSCDVVVVGSCNIDQIAYAPRLPSVGETVHGTKYEVGFGGKGANQSVAAAKLGAKVLMVAKVGDDANGYEYIKNMESLGVNVDHITISKEACTGVAPITVVDGGANSIIIFPGANMLLSSKDVARAASAIKAAKVMVCQLEINEETSLYALKSAKEVGLMTILNPAPAPSNISDEFFKYSDIICPNENEASLLTGIDVVDKVSGTAAAEKLVEMGCNTCVVTLGENGCVFAKANMKSQHVPGIKVEAIDTTGAGDAFIGALAYFLCYFKDLGFVEILSRSCKVAAQSVTKNGTQTSYRSKNQLPVALFQ